MPIDGEEQLLNDLEIEILNVFVKRKILNDIDIVNNLINLSHKLDTSLYTVREIKE